MSDTTDLEVKVAHLERVFDELSDVVAAQADDLARLARRVDLLLQREAEREAETGGGIALPDRRPPHW